MEDGREIAVHIFYRVIKIKLRNTKNNITRYRVERLRFNERVEAASAILYCILSLFVNLSIKSVAMPIDSLDIKIGQMIMVGFRGMNVDSSSTIVRDIVQRKIGGVILFDYDVPSKRAYRNIQSATQVQLLCAQLQSFASIPLSIAIDQEGGKIARLKEKYGFPRSVSQQYLGSINNEDSTKFYAHQTAMLLRTLGINMNMAPVVDLNINPENPVIGKLERSYSNDPLIVTKHARITLQEFQKQNILGVMKHFPGHGSSRHDSHLGIVDVTDTYSNDELKPYADLISSNDVKCIMTAHIFNKKMDEEYPATLSKKIITNLLRDSLRFDGMIISDDLQMKAITDNYGVETAVKMSIQAGVDILVFANNSVYDDTIAEKAVKIIHDAVERGEISRSRIDESYKRIMKLKKGFYLSLE